MKSYIHMLLEAWRLEGVVTGTSRGVGVLDPLGTFDTVGRLTVVGTSGAWVC